jgi:hypothetical protein
MSEKLPLQNQPEAQTSAHYEHLSEHEARNAKAELAAMHHEKTKQQQLEQARISVESQAEVTRPVLERQAEANKTQAHSYISRDLRAMTTQRALQRVRKNMSTLDRAASVIIHTKPLRVLSDTTSRTVARPFPLLFGGLLAFIGTTGYLLFARHIGVEYNYLVWAVLFLAGFGIGLAIDTFRLLARRK